jgi:hypothetical protein
MSLYFGDASRILLKTTPYLILRIIVYLVLGVAVSLYLGLVILIGRVFGGGGGIIFLVGLAVLWGILRLARNYVLYMIKAGHVAVITELINKGSLPEGIGQVDYGKKVVTSLFKDVSVLFVVDQLVSGILRAVNRTVVTVAEILPIPGLDALARAANAIINLSVTYVDESILSYNLSRPKESVWESAKRGVILYAQNWKPILKAAVALAIVNFLAFIIIFVILLIPFGPLAMMAKTEGMKFLWFATAVVLAWCVKLAVVNPFSLIAMILTYNKAIAGQEPNKEWETKLEALSDKFRELKEKAKPGVVPVPA